MKLFLHSVLFQRTAVLWTLKCRLAFVTVAPNVLNAELAAGAGNHSCQFEAPDVSACTGLPPLRGEGLDGLGIAIRCRLHGDREWEKRNN